MGQATLDLPESGAKPAAANRSADELLSQLAGQEIDRLLADAETKGTPEAAPPPPPIEELKLDEAPAESVPAAPAVEKAPATPAPAATTEDNYADHVGELLKQLEVPTGKAAPVSEPTPAPTPAPVEESTTAAEKAALTPAPPVEEVTVQQVLEQVETAARTPIYVRALELLNSPFNFCPDELRDTLGKIAILTMMNSIGVLLYVVLFRKH